MNNKTKLSAIERKFFYEKALEIIEQGLTVNGIEAYTSTSGVINYTLCRLLPSLAYGLNCGSCRVSDIVRGGSISEIFPEIDIFFVNEMTSKAVKGEITVTEANAIRVRKLKEVINIICNDANDEQTEIRRQIEMAILFCQTKLELTTLEKPRMIKVSLKGVIGYLMAMAIVLFFIYLYTLSNG